MFLHRIHLNPRCREARRDLADPYQLHSTLCRAFSGQEERCAPGEFLWRLEPEAGAKSYPVVLVQSRSQAEWSAISVNGWFEKVDPAIDLTRKFHTDFFQPSQKFRFRLRANPCVSRKGKRAGLLRTEDQEKWIERKGEQNGFLLPKLPRFDLSKSSSNRVDVRVSQERMLRGKQHDGNIIRIFSVLYDGILTVNEPDKFMHALRTGVGHGKSMGLGLLSAVPVA